MSVPLTVRARIIIIIIIIDIVIIVRVVVVMEIGGRCRIRLGIELHRCADSIV